MTLYAITCIDKADAAALRTESRPAHIDYLKTQDDKIVLAGALLTDDGENMTGSHFLVNVPDRAAAETFSASDPFTRAGLFETILINRVRKGFWSPELAADA